MASFKPTTMLWCLSSSKEGGVPIMSRVAYFFRSFFLIQGTEFHVGGQQMERVLHLGQSISLKNASLRKMHPATWAEQHQTTPSFPAADFLQTIPSTAVREAGVCRDLGPPETPSNIMVNFHWWGAQWGVNWAPIMPTGVGCRSGCVQNHSGACFAQSNWSGLQIKLPPTLSDADKLICDSW